MARLDVPYTITLSNGFIVITYAATFGAESFEANREFVVIEHPTNPDLFCIGHDDVRTTLNWTRATAPVAASRSLFIEAVAALAPTRGAQLVARATVSQAFAANVAANVLFDTVDSATGGLTLTTSDTITFPVAGQYLVSATSGTAAVNAGHQMVIIVSGGAAYNSTGTFQFGAGPEHGVNWHSVVDIQTAGQTATIVLTTSVAQTFSDTASRRSKLTVLRLS